MSKPLVHAKSSVRRFGGEIEDYLPIHDLLDSSKGALPDNRHRALTHTSWFLSVILERVFGQYFINSAGRQVSVRDIGEQHIQEDFHGFIPTAQDFLGEMEYKTWMEGKAHPPSMAKIDSTVKVTRTESKWDGD